MKNKFWLNHLLGALFAFLFSITSVGVLVTGWDLPVTSGGWLIFRCGLFSVLASVLLYFRYGWCGILLLSVRGAFALWQDGLLWEQMQSLAYTVSLHFHDVYGWRTIGSPLTEEFDLVLILLAYLTACSVSFCICCRKHIVIALPFVILPPAVCLITTDTMPDERYLFLLMLGVVLLLVTDWVRRKNPRQFASLTLRTMIPAAAALGLLFALSPQETYVSHAAELQKTAVDWFQQIKSTAENVVSANITGSFAFQTLNLRSVGPKSDFTYTVMQVTSSYGGTVYLRGRDYDIYTGTAWESSGDRKEQFPAGSDVLGNLTIAASGIGNVLYTPYYSADAVILNDGFVKNSANTKEYSYTAAKNPVGIAADVSGYTNLPPETSEWAGELAEKIINERAGRMSKVQSIADYVRNCASYDLSASAMSSDYSDFARWFLEESDTGYCVHFATAAAVLLRAAHIPARYVEGYMIQCQADEQITVTNQEAHAWVEYYDSGSDVWRLLETTPSGAMMPAEGIAEETAHVETETEETEPESEIPETEPDAVEQPAERVPDQSEDRHENTGTTQNAAAAEHAAGNQSDGNRGNSENSENSGGTSGKAGVSGGNSVSAGEETVPEKSFRIPEWVKNLLWILPVLAVIPLQGNLRIAYKRKQWNAGAANEMALVRWRQSRRLAKRMKVKLPEELDELAMKAKFSQHTLTRGELDEFELFRKEILQSIGQMPWYRKVFLRWILAVG